jgi:hypothetical protein
VTSFTNRLSPPRPDTTVGGREQESAQHTESSIRVYRRSGVTRARLTFADGFVPEFSIHRCDLYFFHDADVLIVVLEISR